jgi:hypothetical protein
LIENDSYRHHMTPGKLRKLIAKIVTKEPRKELPHE